ncbi:MAG: RNA polymerase sigma factor [Flavobacteriales bacterium]
MDQMKAGNQRAFEQLYDLYSEAIYGVVCKIVRSDEIGQDVLQESFVKIWKKAPTYNQKKGSPFTWMLNIARNSAIDKLRQMKRAGKVEIQMPSSNVGSFEGSSHTNVDTIGLKKFVDQLKPELRLMVEYIYFNGYTQQEVADELKIPLGTVKTRSRTAVAELRKVFVKLFLFWI